MSVIFGAIISFVVRFLSKIPFVAKYPKLIAAVLSAVASIMVVAVGSKGQWGTIEELIKLLASQLQGITTAAVTMTGTAVLTHEAVTKPILGSTSPPSQVGGPSH